jgi:hypothetical protein
MNTSNVHNPQRQLPLKPHLWLQDRFWRCAIGGRTWLRLHQNPVGLSSTSPREAYARWRRQMAMEL